MNDDDIRSAFIRQRRNLMGISIAVLFVTYSGLQFTKLNILGNEFVISNPRIINYFLWIAFVYWLVRYFQYMFALSGLRIYMTYEQTLLQLTLPSAREKLNKQISVKMEPLAYEVQLKGEQWAIVPPLFNPFFKRELRFFYDIALKVDNPQAKRMGTEEMFIALDQEFPKEFGAWWRAINHVTWRTPFVTEYVVPPLVAFSVLVAGIIHYFLSR